MRISLNSGDPVNNSLLKLGSPLRGKRSNVVCIKLEPKPTVLAHLGYGFLNIGAMKYTVGGNHYAGAVLTGTAVNKYWLGLSTSNSHEMRDAIIQHSRRYYCQRLPIGNAKVLDLIGSTSCDFRVFE